MTFIAIVSFYAWKDMKMEINNFLEKMVECRASDLFITVGRSPSFKVNGVIEPIDDCALSEEQVSDMVNSIMTDEQRDKFHQSHECNFAINLHGKERFRVSAFYQRNQMAMVLRRIESKIPTFDELHLPNVLQELAMTKRGLILFVGATGTGKSTSLAAMVGCRNQESTGHIVTIEDPIEYVHQHQGCIITQREVGIDTESFEIALKNTLRQAPDVILIGEIRSRTTMEHAISFSETGHLCLATLHANNANQALDRIMHFFPQDQHQQMWMDLSLNLKAIIAQSLIPTVDGHNRCPAVEVMINTPLIADLIRRGDIPQIKEVMAQSNEYGMQTFDQSLFALYKAGQISFDHAMSHADSANDLRLMIKLADENRAVLLSESAKKLSLQ